MEVILCKLTIFLICFASLNILRETFYFYQCFKKLEKYEISNKRMFGIWTSISFIITIILTGLF